MEKISGLKMAWIGVLPRCVSMDSGSHRHFPIVRPHVFVCLYGYYNSRYKVQQLPRNFFIKLLISLIERLSKGI